MLFCCLCRDIWSQFHANPLPAEPQRRQVLQGMSPRAVCTRMLGNLGNMASRYLMMQGRGLPGAHSNMRLTGALIQLLPRYCNKMPSQVITALLEQEQHCKSYLARLYADLLIKGGFEVGMGVAWPMRHYGYSQRAL
jgi:hypothetical protein